MTTRYICADITAEIAGTTVAGRGKSRDLEMRAYSLFKRFNRHAPGTIRTVSSQLVTFGAGLDCQVIFHADFDKGLSQCNALLMRNSPGFGIIALRLFIGVDETDDGCVGKAAEFSCHVCKDIDMAAERIIFADKNRVIPPADAVRTDNIRQSSERFEDSFFPGTFGSISLPYGVTVTNQYWE